MTICDTTETCLPMWRWGNAAELLQPAPGSGSAAPAETGIGFGRFMFAVAALIWQLTAVAVGSAAATVSETAALADSVSAWAWRNVPVPVQLLIAALIVAGVFIPTSKTGLHPRGIAKRIIAAAFVLALSGFLLNSAVRDSNAGSAPAQTAGSPSWTVMEVSGLLEPLVHSTAETIAGSGTVRKDSSGGLVSCEAYITALRNTAQVNPDVPRLAFSADLLWEQVYYQNWASTAFNGAADEVGCVAAEWQSGATAGDILRGFCHALGNGPGFWDEDSSACDWEQLGLPAPVQPSQLLWQTPVHRTHHSRLLLPWYLCSPAGDGSWRQNSETAHWDSEVQPSSPDLRYTPQAVAEACGAWWDSELPGEFGCSEEGDQLVCTRNELDDRVKIGELSDEQITFLALEAAAALRPELFDDRPPPAWAAAVPTAADTHPVWQAELHSVSVSDNTARALAGSPTGTFTAGGLAAANALFFGTLIAAAALAVVVGSWMLLVALVLMPLAVLGYAMAGRPRVLASNAAKLAANGLAVFAAGHVLSFGLLAVVFALPGFFGSSADTGQAQLVYFFFGGVLWFILVRTAWRHWKGTAAPRAGRVMSRFKRQTGKRRHLLRRQKPAAAAPTGAALKDASQPAQSRLPARRPVSSGGTPLLSARNTTTQPRRQPKPKTSRDV